MLRFTPRKFIDMLELNGFTISDIVEKGVDRSYLIPRYKKGERRARYIEYSYKKGISKQAIENIGFALLEMNIAKTLVQVKSCFFNDDFDPLIPEELL